MAHFAELKSKVDPTGFTSDSHQVVERVVVVGNDCVRWNFRDDMLMEKHGVQIFQRWKLETNFLQSQF